MDWGKAKSVLIAIFLMLNIFLFANILTDKFSISESKDVVASVRTILKDRDIKISANIPKSKKSVDSLEYTEEAGFDKNLVYQKLFGEQILDQELKIGTVQKFEEKELVFLSNFAFQLKDASPNQMLSIDKGRLIEKSLRSKISQIGINERLFELDSLVFDNENSVKLKLVYKPKEDYYFDNIIYATYTKKGLSELFVSFRKSEIKSSEKINILNPYKLLLINVDLLSGKEILALEYGYMGAGTEKTIKNTMQNYVLKIRTANDTEYIVDAKTGIARK